MCLSFKSYREACSAPCTPTPPKKPPRRNLSVSPTHPAHLMTMSADGSSLGPGDNNYEYLFLARSGVRSHSDLEELQGIGTQTLGGRRDALLRRGRSQDQYVDMKVRQSFLDAGESFQFRKDPDEETTLTRKHVLNQPIAITASFGNYAIRTTNPRRKLRRHNNDKSYENYEPTHRIEVSKEFMNSVAIEPIFVSNAYITLKSSQESLLDEKREERGGRKMKVLPTSPTHYQQPPTPDHPPPSAMQAEKSIHERIRPLSQEYKRRSRDIETETDEDLLLFPSLEDASSGSLSSSVSLSDKSVSTDNNVEEFVGDAPFAGKFGNNGLKYFALQLCKTGTLEDSLIFSTRAPSITTAQVITPDDVQPCSSGTVRDQGGARPIACGIIDKYDPKNRLNRNVTLDNLSQPDQDLHIDTLYSNVQLGCDSIIKSHSYKKPVNKFIFDRSYSNVEIVRNSNANKEVSVIVDSHTKPGDKFYFDRSCSNVESGYGSLADKVDTDIACRDSETNDTADAEVLYSNIEPDSPFLGGNEGTLKADRCMKLNNNVQDEVFYSNVELSGDSFVGREDTLKAIKHSKPGDQFHYNRSYSNVEVGRTNSDNEVQTEVLYSNVEHGTDSLEDGCLTTGGKAHFEKSTSNIESGSSCLTGKEVKSSTMPGDRVQSVSDAVECGMPDGSPTPEPDAAVAKASLGRLERENSCAGKGDSKLAALCNKTRTLKI